MRQHRIGLGLFARAVYILWAFACLFLGWMVLQGNEAFDPSSRAAPDDIKTLFLMVFVGGLVLFYPLMWVVSAILESDVYEKWVKEGTGGSARWGGVLAFQKYAWARIDLPNGKAPIFFGRTLHKYDPWPFTRKIGVDDENHLVTIAQSRSGKSTTVIWPNLVKYSYSDSVFVLDPKGEHATMTAVHRANRGQRVYVLDPFGMTSGLETHPFNPLKEIDPQSGRAKEDIGEIADACVISAASSTSGTDEHFSDLNRAMITGLIAHVLTTQGADKHNLPAVYDYFMSLRDEKAFSGFLDAMDKNGACGNAPREAVAAYRMAGKNEKGSIFTSMLNSLKWIASDDMRRHLMRSDFSLEELRRQSTSIYVVLDFDAMVPERQGRYMRVLFNLALRKSYVTPLPQDRKERGRRTLFILDEVAQLGHMPKIQRAYRTHAGANVKLWCFFQEWEALASTFTNPRAVIGNSTKQFFGCNDPETAQHIEEYLGQYLHQRQEGSRVHESSKALLDHNEIMNTLGQKAAAQIVVTGEGDKMELKRQIFIPSPDWKPHWEFEDSAFYPLAMRLRKSLIVKVVTAGVLLGVAFSVWQSNVLADEPWYGQLTGKGFFTWVLLGVWIVLFVDRSGKKEGQSQEARRREAQEIIAEVQRQNAEHRQRGERVDTMRDDPELIAAWRALSSEEKKEWLVRKTRPEFDAFVAELRRRIDEEAEKAQAAEPELEVVRHGSARETAHREREDAKIYTPEQDAARKRFYLPEGFTAEQLNERYAMLLEAAGADQVDQITEDYNTLS